VVHTVAFCATGAIASKGSLQGATGFSSLEAICRFQDSATRPKLCPDTRMCRYHTPSTCS